MNQIVVTDYYIIRKKSEKTIVRVCVCVCICEKITNNTNNLIIMKMVSDYQQVSSPYCVSLTFQKTNKLIILFL